MERIIIREVDNTSNVEALSSYDVAYVPGFSAAGNISNYYREPQLVRDRYEFINMFGSEVPTFKSDQAYPDAFDEAAIKWLENETSYSTIPTNYFGNIAAVVESSFYVQVEETPETIPEDTHYYRGETIDGAYTLSLISGSDEEIKASISTILEDQQEDTAVFSSTVNPATSGWYVSGEGGYIPSVDTYIIPATIYYSKTGGVPNMFEEGDADPGYRYALALLASGMPVYYEVMNESENDITVEKMYSGLIARFATEPNDPDDSFDSIGDYSIKFITSGGYPTFEYSFGTSSSDVSSNGLAEAMINMAKRRQDAIALIDHTDAPMRPVTTYDEDSVISHVREWNLDADTGTYGAMFTPWFECSNPIVAYNSQTEQSINNDTMPGSFAYLSTLAAQLLNYNPWLAVSGVSRGKVPYFGGLHTNKPITNNIADSYQVLPNEDVGGKNKISINPLTYIRNYGYCIWGNRTLRDNANGTKASSFLNIRSAVSDIKKRLYETSQQLLFEQNTDVLWVDFTSLVSPLLETMKSDYILSDYAITRLTVDPQTGAEVPAYEVMAVIRIQPVNSVEVFDLTVYLENNTGFELSITTEEQ